MFALASTDNKIYIYDSKSFALKAKVRGKKKGKKEKKKRENSSAGALAEVQGDNWGLE